MAYSLHLTRGDEEDSDISEEEWVNYCEEDSTMQLESGLTGKSSSDGSSISIPGMTFGVWLNPGDNNAYPFYFRRGTISFNYTDAGLEKAKEITEALGASIHGDEGESY